MRRKKFSKLFLPSLRAHMGDWIYYVSVMKLRDVAARVNYAEEIHTSKKLKELLQRSIRESRQEEISKYLTEQPQRFFNAIIVGVYGGNPNWYELDVKERAEFTPNTDISEEGILGFLELSGEEDLFALDGQHRVSGIRSALKKENKPEKLGDEELTVLFVSHKKTESGRERSRRLFSTLNRYAKPVKLSDIIALDEDDVSAIITRNMIENYPLFENERISLSKSHAIHKDDNESFTNIIALYRCIDIILRTKKGIGETKWDAFKKTRPDEKIIKEFTSYIEHFWDIILDHFNSLNEYLQKDSNSENMAIQFRHENGGHVLFRPAGLRTYASTIAKCIKYDWPLEKTVQLLSEINTELSDNPWPGVFWEKGKKRMIARKEHRQFAQRLLLYMIGFDLNNIRYSNSKLLSDYASILNKEREEVELPAVIV